MVSKWCRISSIHSITDFSHALTILRRAASEGSQSGTKPEWHWAEWGGHCIGGDRGMTQGVGNPARDALEGNYRGWFVDSKILIPWLSNQQASRQMDQLRVSIGSTAAAHVWHVCDRIWERPAGQTPMFGRSQSRARTAHSILAQEMMRLRALAAVSFFKAGEKLLWDPSLVLLAGSQQGMRNGITGMNHPTGGFLLRGPLGSLPHSLLSTSKSEINWVSDSSRHTDHTNALQPLCSERNILRIRS